MKVSQVLFDLSTIFVLLIVLLSTLFFQSSFAVGIDEESDGPMKRWNAGQMMTVGIPIEEAIERIRSMPHRRNALIRSLGATSLTQRAGRNLIFRVFLTIGHQNGLTQCTAQVMCEQTCQDEMNKSANNYFDTYPTDDAYVSYILAAIEKGRELGGAYHCDQCHLLYPKCNNEATRQQVLTKYAYLMDVTNYVINKIPS
ncbi:uncharacterized protein LOC113792877 [Dermatophagoides pteronyssinus]|uniref:Uncharacterized protein LOC113792877 n=1 Tax=Dermatophagoides pteronyssinus TaxID=6956 RepID=A0A6P6XZM8_DERPT|nr:uncharacterized protein LOC113792877 [Dermatophagoides pteronyssinus]